MDPQHWLSAISDAAEHTAADAPWVLDAEDHLAGYLYAQRIRRVHRKMVAIAQEDAAHFAADELTVAFLEANNAVFRRKVETSLLQASSLTKQQASELLLHSANLHQHAPELLDLLEQGKTTVAEATLMAQKLRTIRPPAKKQKPDGQPWQPGEFEAATRATEDAKNALGEDLTALAGSNRELPELQREAEQLRHQHHPESAQQRHRAAKQTRHVRITSAPDGMAHLFARITADDGTKIQQALAAAARHLGATSSARRSSSAGHGPEPQTSDTRTHTQLEADVLVDALTLLGSRSPQPAAAAAPPAAQHAQASLPGLENPATTAPATQGTAPGGVTVMVLATLAEVVNLGGTLDPDRLGFLKEHYPELWAQAERNRIFYQSPPAERRTTHPPGLLESGASVQIVGSGVQPGTEASAELLARASAFRAVLTDPLTGYPLGVGRTSYRVPAHIRELIVLRDQHCRHPGCDRPAAAAEMDHVDPWANGGNTGYAEMVAKCPEHHRGKTAGWYRDRLAPDAGDGALTFEDPRSGRTRTGSPPFPMDPKAWEAYRAENTADPPF